jgi:hypothetical protein
VKISALLDEIPEPIRPLLKPLIVAVGVFMTFTSVEFAMLAVAEIKDHNYWSFGVRMAGLVGTFLVGRLVWRGIGSMKENVDRMKNEMVAVPSPIFAEGVQPGDLPVLVIPPPCACGFPYAQMHGRCMPCWVKHVEERFAALGHGDAGEVAGAITLVESDPEPDDVVTGRLGVG